MTVADVDVPTESIEEFTERVKAWAAENLASTGASRDDDRLAAYMREIGLEPNDNLARGRAVLRLMATLPVMPGTNSLPFYAASFSTNMVLIYPGWASNCTILASSTLAP